MSEANAILRAVDHWRRTGVPLLPPATAAAVGFAWHQLGRRLSTDVLALYTAVGGFEDYYEDDRHWCLWSVDRLVTENAARSAPGVLFSDFLVASHSYTVRYEEPGRSSVWMEGCGGPGFQVSAGVVEFLAGYLDDPVNVYLMPECRTE